MSYDPNLFVDELKRLLNLRSDGCLSVALGISRPVIASIRAADAPIGAIFLLRAEELTGIPVRDLRRMMGDRRGRLRVCAALKKVPTRPLR